MHKTGYDGANRIMEPEYRTFALCTSALTSKLGNLSAGPREKYLSCVSLALP